MGCDDAGGKNFPPRYRDLIPGNMGLSVLLSVYLGTEAEELDRCLRSHRPPDPSAGRDRHGAGRARDCRKWSRYLSTRASARSGVPLRTIVPFSEESGASGPALADGLVACKHELVARMDTDDISVPDRVCELQLAAFESEPGSLRPVGGLAGGELTWFDGKSATLVRPAPLDPDEIRRAAVYRNPHSAIPP